MLELRITIAAIMRRYDIVLENPGQPVRAIPELISIWITEDICFSWKRGKGSSGNLWDVGLGLSGATRRVFDAALIDSAQLFQLRILVLVSYAS